MNFMARIGERHGRQDKKMPTRSQSVDQTASSAPLSPGTPKTARPRRLDYAATSATPTTPTTSPAGTPTNDIDWVVAEEVHDNEAAAHHLHGKRRTVSISRSGRYKSRSKGRSIVLSADVYSGTPASPAVVASPTSPPVAPLQPKKDLVKPSARDKSPARPYILLKSDTSVTFAIESTTL